jgi:hypothetical protein
MLKIIKAYNLNWKTGAEIPRYDVVDSRGFILESFSLKRDAKAYIESFGK